MTILPFISDIVNAKFITLSSCCHLLERLYQIQYQLYPVDRPIIINFKRLVWVKGFRKHLYTAIRIKANLFCTRSIDPLSEWRWDPKKLCLTYNISRRKESRNYETQSKSTCVTLTDDQDDPPPSIMHLSFSPAVIDEIDIIHGFHRCLSIVNDRRQWKIPFLAPKVHLECGRRWATADKDSQQHGSPANHPQEFNLRSVADHHHWNAILLFNALLLLAPKRPPHDHFLFGEIIYYYDDN